MMEKIICGEDNVKSFNGLLRQHAPEFHALAKLLHQAGLIDGLRGATLELAPFTEPPKADHPQPPENTAICQQCRHFQPDQVGDGTGAGNCGQNARKAPVWPNTPACKDFA
ncbi:MAG: hypothetical protein PHU14_01565 [Methylovulum sp.]|nr:hypothetical protein [Methylovulum sp.]